MRYTTRFVMLGLVMSLFFVSMSAATVITPHEKIKVLGLDKEKEFSWQEAQLTFNDGNATSGTLYVNAFADNSPVHLTLSFNDPHPKTSSSKIVIVSSQRNNPNVGLFSTRTYSYTGSYEKYGASQPSLSGKLRITYNRNKQTFTVQSVTPPRGLPFNIYNIGPY